MSGRFKFKGSKAVGAIHISAQPADTGIVTIGNKVYEFDSNATFTAGRVQVVIGGDAEATAEALIAAINANKPAIPVTAEMDSVNASGYCIRLVADRVGANGNMVLTESATNLTVSGSGTMLGGENAGIQTPARGEYIVEDEDILADCIRIPTGLTSPRFPQASCRTTAGVVKHPTWQMTVDGGDILLTFAGATDPIAGDIVRWEAYE
jgi:hypothetical protein